MVAIDLDTSGNPIKAYTLNDVLKLHLGISFTPLTKKMYMCEINESYTSHTNILKNTYLQLSRIKTENNSIGYTKLNNQKNKLISQIEKRINNSDTKKTFQKQILTLERILENIK
jgi:hypothetical protein